jgi:hypothetical protein
MNINRENMIFKNRSFLLIMLILSPIIFFWPGWFLDDTGYLLRLYKYSPFPLIDSFFVSGHLSDRFRPLAFFGQHLVSSLSLSAEVFYIYNFVLALISVFILFTLCSHILPKYRLLPVLMMFTPGFIDSFYRHIASERELLFFWSLFSVLFFLPLVKNPKKPSRWIFLSLIPANYLLYIKEPGFVMLGAFITVWALRHRFNIKKPIHLGKKCLDSNKSFKILQILLILSAVTYLIFYLSNTGSVGKTGYWHDLTPEWSFISRFRYSIKTLIMFTFSDPLLIIVLPLSLLVAHVSSKRSKLIESNQPVFSLEALDSLAIASLSYVLLHIALGIYAHRYLLPAYPFAILAISGYLSIISKYGLKIKGTIRLCISLAVIALIANSVFSSLNLAYFARASSRSFMQYNEVFMKEIQNRTKNKTDKIRIILPGLRNISYTSGILSDFLQFYEIDDGSIEFFSWKTENKKIYLKNNSKNEESDFRKGDLILLRPNASKPQTQIIENLKSRLNLREIVRTKSPYYFEIPEIRHLMKYIMLKANPQYLGSGIVIREVDFALFEVI